MILHMIKEDDSIELSGDESGNQSYVGRRAILEPPIRSVVEALAMRIRSCDFRDHPPPRKWLECTCTLMPHALQSC